MHELWVKIYNTNSIKILKDKKNKWSTIAKIFNNISVIELILKILELLYSAETLRKAIWPINY